MTVTLLDKQRLMMAIMGDRRLSPTAKNVAFVLLNHLNTETLRCDPKVKSIGEQCCVSERTVCAALAELRGCEWLEQRRRRGSSSFTFSFRGSDDPQKPAGLMPDDPQEPADHRPADPQDRAGLDKQDPAGLDTQKPAALTKTDNSETGKLKPGKKLLRPPAASDAETDLAFGEWWPHYPKKIEKEGARREHARVLKTGKATNTELIAGAQRYAAQCAAAGTEPRFIKGPQRWLNAGCWSDEPSETPPSFASNTSAHQQRTSNPHLQLAREYHEKITEEGDVPDKPVAGRVFAIDVLTAHRSNPGT